MGDYADTLKDIETSLGIVPGFMKALPDDVLVQGQQSCTVPATMSLRKSIF